MKNKVFAVLALASLAILVSAGCQSLNKFDPADQGNPAAQLAQAVHSATTQPTVQGGATIAQAATGYPIVPIITGVGSLALILAGIFGSKYAGAQAHLDVAQEAAGVTSNAAAIANLIGGSNPSVQKAEQIAGTVAGTVAAIAPAIGSIAPGAANVASEVGAAASAVQQAMTGAVTITKVGSSPIQS